MRASLLGLVIVTATCTVAFAEPANTGWSGFYAGAHGGYGWTSVDVQGNDKEGAIDPKGGLGGLHAGYLWQWQQLVAGVEGDYSWSGMDWNRKFQTGTESGDTTVSTDWLASIGARLGYDLGPALLYGTAGIAWTEWSLDSKWADAGSVDRVKGGSTGAGWVIGGGGEVKLTEHILLRLEALHYRFNHLDVDAKVNGVPSNDGADKIDEKTTVVRGGASWRF